MKARIGDLRTVGRRLIQIRIRKAAFHAAREAQSFAIVKLDELLRPADLLPIVARQLCRGGKCCGNRLAVGLPVPLVVKEEKILVLLNRSAHIGAEGGRL